MDGFSVFKSDDADEFFLKLTLHSFKERDVENDSQNSIGSHNETSGTLVRRLFGDIDTKGTSASFFPRLIFGHCVELCADAMDALFVFFAGLGCCAQSVIRSVKSAK